MNKTDKKDFDLTALDDFSARVADKIFSAYPDWTKFAVVVYDEQGYCHGKGHLLISLRSPSAAKVPLTLDTRDRELTVSFGEWHHHYTGWWHEDPESQDPGIQEALNDVTAILAGRLMIAVAYTPHGTWHSSWLLSDDERPEMPEGAATLAIRSWSGTRDEPAEAKKEEALPNDR